MQPEPYKCRPRYLWLGAKDALASKTANEKQRSVSGEPVVLAALIAPFLVISVIAYLAKAFARPTISLIREYGTPKVGAVVASLAALAALSVPLVFGYRAWRALQGLCKKGWELSQTDAP